MFAIIDTTSREVLEILEERPKGGAYDSPLLAVYVTTAQAANLTPPSDEWVKDPNQETVYNRIHTPGTIVPQAQLDAAIARQNQLRTRLQTILVFAQGLNGRSFASLTVDELKGLLQLQLARNGMVDINGNVDLSDFTIDNILRIL